MRSVLVLGALATVAATDVCASLERDILGKVVPFLASASGRYYFGGKATAGAPKSVSGCHPSLLAAPFCTAATTATH